MADITPDPLDAILMELESLRGQLDRLTHFVMGLDRLRLTKRTLTNAILERATHGLVDVITIAKMTGAAPHTIRSTFSQLLTQGRLVRIARGQYRIPQP